MYLFLLLFRNRINAAIVQLTDSGDLTRLENKWWIDECGYEAKVSKKKLKCLMFFLNHTYNGKLIVLNFYDRYQ